MIMPSITTIIEALRDAIVFGCALALMAAGLSITYSISRIANFAHGDYVVAGIIAYLVYTLAVYGKVDPDSLLPKLGWPDTLHLVARLLLAFMFGAGVALASLLAVYRPLRLLGATPLQLMVASMGVELVLRNGYYIWYSAVIGASTVISVAAGPVAFKVLGATIYVKHLIPVVTLVIVLVLMSLFLMKTMIGVSMRAVADNPELAEATGINTTLVEILAWIIGGGLAGLGGALWFASMPTPSTHLMESGWLLLAFVFAAVTLGGLGSIYGSIVAAFIITFAYYPITNVVIPLLQAVGVPIDPGFGYIVPLATVIISLLVMPEGLAPHLRKLWYRIEERWRQLRYELASPV